MTATSPLAAIEEVGRLQAELAQARRENEALSLQLQQARRDWRSANGRICELLSERTGEKLSATPRRIQDIEALRSEGFPVQKLSKHRYRIGSLTLLVGSGRWSNAATGQRGVLRGWTIRELVDEQLPKSQGATA